MMMIDESDVKRVLRMADLIPVMEKALADFSSGRVVQPVRQVIPVDKHKGFLGLMPALSDGLGVKLVTFYPGNKDLPTHMALITLFRPEDGEPLAVLDGRLITEMRTAAVSAAATKHLAHPEARSLAILGSGVQARSHFEALGLVRTFEDVRVSSPNHGAKFAAEIGARSMSAEDAVRDADVVVVATSSTTPVLKGEWLKKGAHVNAVGACRPDWRELDDAAMKNVVYVDSREAAMKESGDVLLSKAEIHAELGELFAGKVEARTGATTIFKSLGMAVEDVSAAQLVYTLLGGNEVTAG